MKLNCKPGDMAVVIGDGPFAGMIVEILYAAPMEEFNLPDGYPHEAGGPAEWVIKMPRPVPALIERSSIPRMTIYGCGRDSRLRPIRDSDGEDETLAWAGKPAPAVKGLTEGESQACVKSKEVA